MATHHSEAEEFHVEVDVDFTVPFFIGKEEGMIHVAESFRKGNKKFICVDTTDGFTFGEPDEMSPHRWVNFQARECGLGIVAPTDEVSTLEFFSFFLENLESNMGVTGLVIESFSVRLIYKLNYAGNHAQLFAESLFHGSPFTTLLNDEEIRAANTDALFAFILDEKGLMTASIKIACDNDVDGIVAEVYGKEAIQVTLAVCRSWGDRPDSTLSNMCATLLDIARDIATKHVEPTIVQPIRNVIKQQ